MSPSPHTTRHRSLAPTSALDHALEALAHDDPELALRWAVPALADEGSGAAAADLVGRALARLGTTDLAVEAHRLAVALLVHQGLGPHAVAAALAVRELAGDDAPLAMVARAFGADAPHGSSMRPPSLRSEDVSLLDEGASREGLVALAAEALAKVPRPARGSKSAAQRLPLWSALPTAAFERFARALTVHTCAPSHRIITEGEPGHSAFILARGEVRVTRAPDEPDAPEVELAVIGAGGIVGEMALVTEAPRAASVTATRGALVLEAPRQALDEAAADLPAVGEQVIAFCRRRLIDNVFRTSTVLREIPTIEREGLAQRFATRTYEPGEVLIAEGSAGPGLHLIAAGQVEVVRNDAGGETLRVALLDPGNCVGEISMVLRRAATASVVATRPTVSLLLEADQFLEIVRDRPSLLHKLYELAVQREDDLRSVMGQEAEEIDDAVMV